MRCELFDAGGVRAPTQADVDGVADLQHVATVQGSGWFDSDGAIAKTSDHVGNRPSLGLS